MELLTEHRNEDHLILDHLILTTGTPDPDDRITRTKQHPTLHRPFITPFIGGRPLLPPNPPLLRAGAAPALLASLRGTGEMRNPENQDQDQTQTRTEDRVQPGRSKRTTGDSMGKIRRRPVRTTFCRTCGKHYRDCWATERCCPGCTHLQPRPDRREGGDGRDPKEAA